MLAIITLFAIVTLFLSVLGIASVPGKKGASARRVVATVLLVATMMDYATPINSAVGTQCDNEYTIEETINYVTENERSNTMNLGKKLVEAATNLVAGFTAAMGFAVSSVEESSGEPTFSVIETYTKPVLGSKPETVASFVIETENGEEVYDFGVVDDDCNVGPVSVYQSMYDMEEDETTRKLIINGVKTEMARHFMDSIHDMDRALSTWKKVNGLNEEHEENCDDIIAAAFMWRAMMNVKAGDVRWYGRTNKNIQKNYRACVDMLIASNSLKYTVDMDDSIKESKNVIRVGQYIFIYDVDQVKKVYGKDLVADVLSGDTARNFDLFVSMKAKTLNYLGTLGDSALPKLATNECLFGHLYGCAAPIELVRSDDDKVDIVTKWADSKWEETKGLPVFIMNVASKKNTSLKLSVNKIVNKATKAIAKEDKNNDPSDDEIMNRLLKVDKDTNLTMLESLNTRYSVYQGRVAQSPSLRRHLLRNPDSIVFQLNMMDVPSKDVDFINNNGIYVVSVDPETDELTEIHHLSFIGQSVGGEKTGTGTFVEIPEDYEFIDDIYVVDLWLTCLGLNKARDEFFAEYEKAKARGEKEDFENDVFDIAIELIAEHASGLCKVSTDEDGNPEYKCSRSKFISRLALMHSTVMRESGELSFAELLRMTGENIYVVDGSKEQVNEDEGQSYSVNGIMSVRKIDKYESRKGDGGSLGSDKFCAALAVKCPDVYFTLQMFMEYCSIIDQLTKATGCHEWSAWANLKDKDHKDYNEKLDALYRRYLELDDCIPGAFQVRNTGGAKTVIVKANMGAIDPEAKCVEAADGPMKAALDEINAPMIGEKLNTVGLLTDTNAFKFLSDGWADEFYICAHSDVNGHSAKISAQGWLTLDITNPKEAMDIVMNEVILPLMKGINSPIEMLDYLNAQHVVIDSETLVNGVNDFVIMKKLLSTQQAFFYSKEFNLSLSKYVAKALDDAEKGTLKVQGSKTYFVVIDQYEHMNVLLEREFELAGVKKLKTMEELVGNTFKKSRSKDATMAFIYGANKGKTAAKASAIRYPLLSTPEWFKLDVLSYSRYYNGCKGVCMISGRTNIIAAMQGGDTDGDHIVVFFVNDNDKLSKLIYNGVVTQFGVSRIYVDSADDAKARGYKSDAANFDDGIATADHIFAAYAANNVGDDVGKIANSAMFASDVFAHLKTLMHAADVFGAEYIKFLAPYEKWNVVELDEFGKYRFVNGKENPLNSYKADEVDETNHNFSAQRSIDGIYIPNELGDKAEEFTMVNKAEGTRLFTGWILSSDNSGPIIVAEMPYISELTEYSEDGEKSKEWKIDAFFPKYDKRDGIDRDFMAQKEEDIEALQKNALFTRAMRFGHERVRTDRANEFALGRNHKVRVRGEVSLFDMEAKDIKSLVEINDRRHEITVEDIAYQMFLLSLCNAQEAGREIDKKKHIVGAIWNLVYGCTPTWKLHVNESKNKELSESQARSQYVSASVLGAIHSMVMHERKKIESVIEKRCNSCYSMTPYLFSLVSEINDIYALDEVENDVRKIKCDYLREITQYGVGESEEAYVAMEKAKTQLYSLTNNVYGDKDHQFMVGIETIAVMTYFVGCEGSITKSSEIKSVEGKTTHSAPTTFSMILGNELVALLENAEDAINIVRVPKNATTDNLSVHDGWMWITDDDGEEHLYKRVTNDMEIVYDHGDIEVQTVNGTKYARVYRNTADKSRAFCSPVVLDGDYNIVCDDATKTRANLLMQSAKNGTVNLIFRFDKETKAIVAKLLKDNGKTVRIGVVDMFDVSSNITGKFKNRVERYRVCDVDLLKGITMLGLVNTQCVVSVDNAKVNDRGNIVGLSTVSTTPLQ